LGNIKTAFIKELGTLAVKAGIADGDASAIMLFIEKHPEEVKIGLNNSAAQKKPRYSLRLCCRYAAFLSSAHDRFQQPDLERRMERNLQPLPTTSVGSRIAPATLDRKATHGPLSSL
jgi:hypothetical protein